MPRRVVRFEQPIDDLTVLGQKLQQAIVLTKARLPFIKGDRLKRKARFSLDQAQDMFITLSGTVQTVDRMTRFLEQGFGLSVDDLFELAENDEHAARISTHSAMVLVNNGIKLVLNDLAEVNAAIDKEVGHGERKT